MANNKELLPHFAITLAVRDISAAIAFYRDQLGFSLEFEWNDPVDYAVLRRGENVNIHLSKRQDDLRPSEIHTAMYVFVQEVDELYQEFLQKGVTIKAPVGDREYGMRDFDVVDPEGHILTFGMGISG